MNVLWLFDTCGYVFGPAILLAGAAALALCFRATLRPGSGRARRAAVLVALSPAALGVCGFLVGLVVCWRARVAEVPWGALGKVCLAGAVVSAVPLIWALLLPRPGGTATVEAAGEPGA